MPRKKTAPAVGDFPAVPYEANRHQQLVCYWFSPDQISDAAVDGLLGDFLQRCMQAPRPLTRPLEIWRGTTNAREGALKGIGVSGDAPQRVFDSLLDVVGNASCDNGMRTPLESEFEPFAMLAGADIWKFDAAATPRSAGRFRLGKKRFDVRFLPYVWKKRTGRRTSSPVTYEQIVEALDSWRGQLTKSLIDNWSFFREHWTELVNTAGTSGFDAAVLQRVCERALLLRFVELRMPEHGRIVCRPILTPADGGWAEAGFDVHVLLHKGLTPGQKVAAVAHELGHYIHHLPHYVFFSRLPLQVMNSPAIEPAVAREWQPLGQTYYLTTEMRADLTACEFLVPGGLAEDVSADTFTVDDNDPAQLESMWLRRAVNVNENDVSEAHYRALLQTAADATTRRRSAGYDPGEQLLERLGWCMTNRKNANTMSQQRQREQQIEEAFNRLVRIVTEESSEAGEVSTGGAQLYRRLTLDELPSIAVAGHWEPLVIEPRTGTRAQGYLGIKPAFLPNASLGTRLDWVPHPGPPRAACGFAEEWLEEAESKDMGLMVFAMDPVERELRHGR